MSYKFAIQAEYIWIDGQTPTSELRSKTKIIRTNNPDDVMDLKNLPEWGFDGSSTMQAEGKFSDCLLKPVYVCKDPLRGAPNVLVMCEVLNPDGTPHVSNTRHSLAKASSAYAHEEAWGGIEQEYTLYHKSGALLAWHDFPAGPEAQGRWYCGVGANRVLGRELIERHTKACIDAHLKIDGTNIEVMPGQAEFQVGPLPVLELSDQLWIMRWLMHRIGENLDLVVSLAPKPLKNGDWNGAGAHYNFSTKKMRSTGGLDHIKQACQKLGQFHAEHMKVYGSGNTDRLTGKHETCDINTFRFGVSDRGASIRIPMGTANAGFGYLEDRRPAANADPYQVSLAILETICGQGFSAQAMITQNTELFGHSGIKQESRASL